MLFYKNYYIFTLDEFFWKCIIVIVLKVYWFLNIYYILTQKNFQISREYIYKETQYENRFIIGNKSLRRAEWKMNSSLQKLIFLFFLLKL